jgi:hypothetical protein
VNDQELGHHEEQVIGRALHALDDIELDVADDVQVLEYQRVLSYVPFEEVTPPPALEARVLDAARAARQPDVPSLVARHRKTRRIVAVGSAAVVAAAVALMLIVGGGSGATQTKVRLTEHAQQNFAAELRRDPSHRAFDLHTPDGQTVASVVLRGNDGAIDNLHGLVPLNAYVFAVTGNNGAQKVVGTVSAVQAKGYTFSGPVTGAAIIDPSGTVVARGMLDR